MNNKKECSKCGILKNITEFHKHKLGADGHRGDCKDCANKKGRKHYSNNIIKIKRINNQLLYSQTNKMRIKQKEYRNNNSDSIEIYQLKYRQSDNGKEIHRIHEARYRAQKLSTSDGSITINSVSELLDAQGGVCNICGIDINERTSRHLDHVYPLVKGGIHTLDNVQWLCKKCNLSKGSKLIKRHMDINDNETFTFFENKFNL